MITTKKPLRLLAILFFAAVLAVSCGKAKSDGKEADKDKKESTDSGEKKEHPADAAQSAQPATDGAAADGAKKDEHPADHPHKD